MGMFHVPGGLGVVHVFTRVIIPDPWEDLESRTPNMVPYTTIGYFLGTLEGDLLSRSAQGSGMMTVDEAKATMSSLVS